MLFQIYAEVATSSVTKTRAKLVTAELTFAAKFAPFASCKMGCRLKMATANPTTKFWGCCSSVPPPVLRRQHAPCPSLCVNPQQLECDGRLYSRVDREIGTSNLILSYRNREQRGLSPVPVLGPRKAPLRPLVLVSRPVDQAGIRGEGDDVGFVRCVTVPTALSRGAGR